MGSGAWVSLWSRRQSPPEPPGCFILEDLQTLHIPTNKKLEVWTQYGPLLSFLGGSSFMKILKSGKNLRNNRRPVGNRWFPLGHHRVQWGKTTSKLPVKMVPIRSYLQTNTHVKE